MIDTGLKLTRKKADVPLTIHCSDMFCHGYKRVKHACGHGAYETHRLEIECDHVVATDSDTNTKVCWLFNTELRNIDSKSVRCKKCKTLFK